MRTLWNTATRRGSLGVLSPWVLSWMLWGICLPLAADEIRLDNGDRITGTVERLEQGKLVVTTAYAGEIEIAWEAVVGLTTEDAATVVLTDGTRLRGVVSTPEEGSLSVRSPDLDRPATLELARIEAIDPPEAPPVRLSGDVQLSLVSARGNTDRESLVLQGELQARTEVSRYTFGAQIDEAEEDGNETASRATAYLGYDLFLSEDWYLASNARFTEDDFQDLNLRSSVGLGIGHQFWERERSKLSLELGASYVNEDFLVAEDESYAAGRWALDVTLPLASGASFFHNHTGLLSLEDSDDLLIQSRTGLRFSLFRSFIATAQVNFDWDNSPSPGREKDDTTVLLTLGYEW